MTSWVANGLSQDLPPGVVMHGECGGQDLAIWRSMSGKIAAWKDRCQHRGMRLSHGFVRGETLSCIYHGWVYGTSGACSRIPAHPDLTPPAAIKAEAYDCREAHGLIWVAPSGTAGAPPDLDGLTPIRSLTVNSPQITVPGLVGQAILTGEITVAGKPAKMAIVLQPRNAGQTSLHVLSDAAPVAISRWLESLRLTLEEGVQA